MLLSAQGRMLLGVVALVLANVTGAMADGPPVTPRHDVINDYFGTRIADPYQWMETDSSAFATWLAAQGDYARAELDRLPGRPMLLDQLRAIDAAQDNVKTATRCRNGWLYEKTPAGEDIAKLFLRGDDGRDPDRSAAVHSWRCESED